MATDVSLAELSNLDLLALLVASEAGGEPLAGQVAGQVAVVCTVTERLARRRAQRAPDYGATLRQVMLMPFQYSGFLAPMIMIRAYRIYILSIL